MNRNHFVNSQRTPEQRREIYYYLRYLGLSRDLVKSICGRSNTKIIQTLKNLDKSCFGEPFNDKRKKK